MARTEPHIGKYTTAALNGVFSYSLTLMGGRWMLVAEAINSNADAVSTGAAADDHMFVWRRNYSQVASATRHVH